jgi:hypothetical protein
MRWKPSTPPGLAESQRQRFARWWIPLLKIADRVEVIVDLKGKRASGPPLVFKE